MFRAGAFYPPAEGKWGKKRQVSTPSFPGLWPLPGSEEKARAGGRQAPFPVRENPARDFQNFRTRPITTPWISTCLG